MDKETAYLISKQIEWGILLANIVLSILWCFSWPPKAVYYLGVTILMIGLVMMK